MSMSTMLQSMPQALPEAGAANTVELAAEGARTAAVQGDQGLDILLLDLNHPWQAAVRLERKD